MESEIEDVIIASESWSLSDYDFKNDSSVAHLGQLTITYHKAVNQLLPLPSTEHYKVK